MTNLRGPFFLWLCIVMVLYAFHVNMFGLCDFLQRYDLPPVVFLLWLFMLFYLPCNEEKRRS